MCDRFDHCGFVVKHIFGVRRRIVTKIPGIVTPKSWLHDYSVVVRAQSLMEAYELLDQLIERKG